MDYSNEKYTNAESGRDFEDRVARVLRDFGWIVLQTPASNDFGADIIAEFESVILAIQCKFYSAGYIGRSAIQEVLYAKLHYEATRAIVIFEGSLSNSTRTEGARHGVEFVRLSELVPNHELDVSEKARLNRIALEREAQLKLKADAKARALAIEQERKLKQQQEEQLKESFEEYRRNIELSHRHYMENRIYSFELHTKIDAHNMEIRRTRPSRVFKRFTIWKKSTLIIDVIMSLILFGVFIFSINQLLNIGSALLKGNPSTLLYFWGVLSILGVGWPAISLWGLWYSTINFIFAPDKYWQQDFPVRPTHEEYESAKEYLSRKVQTYEVAKKLVRSLPENPDNSTIQRGAAADSMFQLRVAETSLTPSADLSKYHIPSNSHLPDGLPTVTKSPKFKCPACSSSLTLKAQGALRFRCPKCKAVADVPRNLWDESS